MKNYFIKTFKLLFLISFLFIVNKNIYSEELSPVMKDELVLFSFQAPEAKVIYVAGDFNSWLNNVDGKITSAEDIYILKGPDAEGIWQAVVNLNPGKYIYKFVVDGIWYPSGDNLTVEIYKDKDNKLKIKETAPGPNTKYSGKIFFGGKFIFQIPYKYDKTAEDWFLSSASNCINFDISASVFDNVKGFLRLATTGSEYAGYFLELKKAHIDLLTDALNLYAFYNEKIVQFDDPVKTSNMNILPYYDEIEFADELNSYRKYGLNSQGVLLNTNISGFNILGFYSDNTKTNIDYSDTFGMRLKKDLNRFKFGITIKNEKGKPGYPYTDPYEQFPDPESPYGLFVSTPNMKWYRQPGLNELYYSGDFGFKLLPFIDIYCEYGQGKNELSARYTNSDEVNNIKYFHDSGLTSPDTKFKIYKTWDLYNYNILSLGSIFEIKENLKFELGIMEQNYETSKIIGQKKPGTSTILSRIKYELNNINLGLEIEYKKADRTNERPENCIFFNPYAVKICQSENLFIDLDNSLLLRPVINLKLTDNLAGKLSGRVLSSSINLFNKTYDFSSSEFTANLNWGLTNKIEIITEGRLFSLNSDYYDLAFNNGSLFLGINYKLTKNVRMLVGYGLYSIPVESDEDEQDERYLYLDSIFKGRLAYYGGTGIRTGINDLRALKDSENELANDKRITVRAEMKF